MSDTIKVFDKYSLERKKLEAVANLMSSFSPSGSSYWVGETYFDYGLDWRWTTILCTYESEYGVNGFSTYQALNPRQQEAILKSESIMEIAEIAKIILESSLLDKVREDVS